MTHKITQTSSLKTLSLAVVLFLTAFLMGLNAQVPITYYDFETSSHTTGENTADQTINTVQSSSVTRSNNVDLGFSYGAGTYHKGPRNGMSLESVDWSTVSSEPGINATDYYQFSISTAGFEGIYLSFDYLSKYQNKNFYGPKKLGLLYSTNNGSSFSVISGTSVFQEQWVTRTYNLTSISGLNNNANIIFRIYGFDAKGEHPRPSLMIDNLTIYALGTVNTDISKTLLNEIEIYKSVTSGATGYLFPRYDFTVKANAKIKLNGQLAIRNTLTMESGSTIDFVNSSNVILDYDGEYVYGLFKLNDNANIVITSNDGIAPEDSYYGNVMTAFRNYSSNANYKYFKQAGDNSNTKLNINPQKYSAKNAGIRNIEVSETDYATTKEEVSNKVTSSFQNKSLGTQRTGEGLPSSVKNVTIENQDGVFLTKPITITGTLNLAAGTFYTDSCTVSFSNTASNPSESISSKIEGVAVMNARTVGTGSLDEFLGTIIYGGVENIGNVTITRKTGNLGTVTVGTSSSIQCHWDVDITGSQPVSGRDVIYKWLSSWDGTITFTGLNPAQMYKSDDFAAWNPVGNEIDVSASSPYRIMDITVNHFSYYVAAGKDAPLPVELTSFNANVINGKDVKLNWSTASEINNAGFEIYRSELNSNVWNKIGFAKGNNTTNQTSNYSFTDSKLNAGKYNYKLKQIDNNGNYHNYDLNGFIEIGNPGKYEISQNYPNPFNPSTKIDFQLPKDAKVTIKVYDLSGKEIKTLVNETKSAGYHTVAFDAGNLSSGVYFYTMVSDSYSMTKKMVVMK